MRILSFDPGLTATGYAVSTFDINTGNLLVDHYDIFKPFNLAAKLKDETNTYGQRIVSLNMLKLESERLFNLYKPDVVVSEDIFFNPRTPTAYITLAMCIHVFEQMCMQNKKCLYRIPPRKVKMIMCGNGNADKIMVYNSIMANEKIIFENENKKEIKLISHASDAVAIGWTWCVLDTLENKERGI